MSITKCTKEYCLETINEYLNNNELMSFNSFYNKQERRVTFRHFSKTARSYGIKMPKKYFTTTNIDNLKKAAEMYFEGIPLLHIYNNTHIESRTLERYLKNNGYRLRNKLEQQKNNNLDENYFENIDTEEKAYWLGFLFADGSISIAEGSQRITLELSNIDYDHLEKLKSSLKATHKIYSRKNREISSLQIASKKMTDDLISYGCIIDKTNYGYIDLNKIPNRLYNHFMRGFSDGDGYIDKKRYRSIITVKSYDIVKALCEILEENNIAYNIIDEHTYYRIEIVVKDNFFKYLDFLYKDATIYLQRKYKIYLDRIQAHLG